MTPLTTDRLRVMIEAAERATPGPWHTEIVHDYIRIADAHGLSVAASFYAGEPDRADAAHIAACDPQTIIALCRIALAAQDYVDAYGNDDPISEPYEAMRNALREAGML